jgi:hypothetical protein
LHEIQVIQNNCVSHPTSRHETVDISRNHEPFVTKGL